MAFTSHHSIFIFKSMPIVLNNALGTDHSFVDVIIGTVKWKFALVFLEEVIVFS